MFSEAAALLSLPVPSGPASDSAGASAFHLVSLPEESWDLLCLRLGSLESVVGSGG